MARKSRTVRRTSRNTDAVMQAKASGKSSNEFAAKEKHKLTIEAGTALNRLGYKGQVSRQTRHMQATLGFSCWWPTVPAPIDN